MRTRRLFLVGFGLLAAGLSSCAKGDGRKPTFPATGKLARAGKPVANAAVVFHPVGESGPDVVKPRGTTGADGSFQLTTYDGNDGAPAGDYQVTVELWATDRPDAGPTNHLPAKYAKPATSGLTAKVNAAPTELAPIEIK